MCVSVHNHARRAVYIYIYLAFIHLDSCMQVPLAICDHNHCRPCHYHDCRASKRVRNLPSRMSDCPCTVHILHVHVTLIISILGRSYCVSSNFSLTCSSILDHPPRFCINCLAGRTRSNGNAQTVGSYGPDPLQQQIVARIRAPFRVDSVHPAFRISMQPSL